MNKSVLYRGQLQAGGTLGNTVLKNFEAQISADNEWGQAEHNDDGTHSDVTAETVSTSGLGHFARLGIGPGYAFFDSVGNTPKPVKGLDVIGASLIYVHDSTTVGAIITGLDPAGRQHGEIVALVSYEENSAGPGFTLRQGASPSPGAGWGFYGDPGTGNVDRTILINRFCLVMYSPLGADRFGTNSRGWRVLIG